MVLADVGAERLLVVGGFEVVQEPWHVSGNTHPPQLVRVAACALLQRGEQLARRVEVEATVSAVEDVKGVAAEVVSKKLVEAELVCGGNAGQPRRQRFSRGWRWVQRPSGGRVHASSRSKRRRRSVGPA